MKSSVMELIFKYRWLMGGLFWFILVFFQIHGSSIGIYAALLDAPELNPGIWGLFHHFQLDEWAVFTPMAFSQYFDGGQGAFSAMSNIPRAAMTDVTFFYGQPCWNLITVFRPFLWGYLFLSPGYALSFFWVGRTVVLFLITYEFGLIFTKNNKTLSLGYAALFTFAPVVQWWFSVNAFVDMLISAHFCLLMIWKYIGTANYRKRALYALLIAYFMLAYAFSIYPVWQISFGYVFFMIAGCLIYSQKKVLVWSKLDWIYVSGILLLISIILLSIIYQSRDTIQAILNTEYPGHRISGGGGFDWRWLFSYPLLYIIPYGFPMNMTPTGGGSFISFAPIGIIIAIWQYVKLGIKDYFVWVLIILSTVYTSFFLFPWPEWLSQITLFSHVPQGRLLPALQFMQMLILFRVLITGFPSFNKKSILLICGAYLLLVGHVSWLILDSERRIFGLMVIMIFSLCFCLYLFSKRHHIWIFFILVAAVSGFFANPVSSGVQSIYGTALGNDIRTIAAQDRGKWIVESTEQWGSDKMDCMNSFPIMFGAPTINSVNTYPYWPRWEALKIDSEQHKALNRFSHMNIFLIQDGPTQYLAPKGEGTISDLVDIKLSVSDLKKIDASYIMTKNDLSAYSGDTISFQLTAQDNGYRIYHIIYND